MKTRLMMSCVVVASLAGLAAAQPGNAPAKDNKKEATPATNGQPASDGQQKPKPEITLKVGSQAPSIKVDKWVKGAEVTGFEKGKPYIVEFWATWCPPCRESIPHLSQVAASHKGLTVIGVASSERPGKDGDKRLEKLEQFVKEKGDEMAYTVAFDGDREMGKEWMAAAGVNTIPTAFLVNGEGKIAWIGNPLDEQFDAEVAKLTGAPAPAPATDTTVKPHGNDAIKKKK